MNNLSSLDWFFQEAIDADYKVRPTSCQDVNVRRATPNPDHIVVVVSRHRLNFLILSYEEEGRSLDRGWRGRYYGPPCLVLPVLPDGGTNTGSYKLQGQQ